MPYRSGSYALTPPSLPVFVISVVLAAAAMLVHYANVTIPFLNSARIFDVLALGYVVILIGVLLRRV